MAGIGVFFICQFSAFTANNIDTSYEASIDIASHSSEEKWVIAACCEAARIWMGGFPLQSSAGIEKILNVASKVEGVLLYASSDVSVETVTQCSTRYSAALKPGREVAVLNPSEV